MIRKRTQARECALQILYQYEMNPEPIEKTLTKFWDAQEEVCGEDIREFTKKLVLGTVQYQAEIDTIKEQIAESKDTEKPKVHFDVGETVKITDGPFLNFSGVIEEIEPERGKLKVTVSIFGRNTPVELEYWQVEKG